MKQPRRVAVLGSVSRSRDDPDLAGAIRFVREQACDPVRVEHVLAPVWLSRSTLEKRFRACLGRTIHGEIQPFRDAFPDRWYNCGVAEQNMTGAACGVAMKGNIAITYSIADFPTLRCLEQIRNDVCYHEHSKWSHHHA